MVIYMALHLKKVMHSFPLRADEIVKDGFTAPQAFLDLGTEVTDELGWIWI